MKTKHRYAKGTRLITKHQAYYVQGAVLGDGILLSDGTVLGDGTEIGDSVVIAMSSMINGDNTASMSP